MSSAIVASGINKSFGDVEALSHLELDVPDGAFFVLLGPSGAGKTTTLRVIAGLEKPDTGTVHLNGIDATKATPAERDLAMVFQSYALYPKQTAAQNIASPLRARKLSKADIDAQLKRVSALLHIEELMNRHPAQMSGGQMQRVALGRALVRDPRAFLMDEPLTNLDLKLRVEMRTELTRIHRSLGRTFLYVTNDQVEAMSMADRVAVLRQGTVQQVGSPTEIYDNPANRWVATFVGSPRMNLLECAANGRLEGEGWTLPNPGFGIEADQKALLGVRAEDLSLDVREESAVLDGTVYAVEPLGDRTLVDIEIGSHRVVVQGGADDVVQHRRQGPGLRRSRPRPPVRRRDGVGNRAAMIDAPLPPVLRRARILERVQRDGGATLADLASEHAVSPVTVHRDLELLSGEGLLERVRGGARSLPDARPRIETAWNARVREAADEKDAIAAHARGLVEDGSTIFVDASSTGLALARALEMAPPTELTLVTNSPAIALGLTADTIHVIVPPGELNQHMRVLTGRWTVEFLAELNIAVAFISAAGVSLEHGLTTSRSGLADTLNAAAGAAAKTVGLFDSSKFQRSSLLTVRSAQSLDVIITDGGLDAATIAEFRAAGVNLVVVDE